MRPVKRYLLWLILAALVSISFRLAEDSLSFHLRFHWPPEWRSLEGSGYKPCSGPSQVSKAVLVRGWIFQIVPLVNGVRPDRTLRRVRLTFEYMAPNGGAWAGLIGDATRSSELDLSSHTKLSFPDIPDNDGLYRASLPAAAVWTPVTIDAGRRTNNPQMTIVLGGTDSGWDARFSDVLVTYPDHGDELIANGSFVESWPLRALYPEWLGAGAESDSRAGFVVPPGIPNGLGGWAPARFLTLIALVSLGFAARGIRRSGSRWAAVSGVFAWIMLSSLVVLGSGGLPDLGRVAVDNLPLKGWEWLPTGLAWILQMGVFVGLGWLGRQIVGRLPAVWGILMIPPLGALCMTASIGLQESTGKPIPLRDMSVFDPVWLVAGAAALCAGVLWADRSIPGRPGGPNI